MHTTELANKDSFARPPEHNLDLKIADYVHPVEVLGDDRLELTEKRAILSAWASDACAVDSKPAFRWLSGTPGPIHVDHVLEALRALDEITGFRQSQEEAPLMRAGPIGSAYVRQDRSLQRQV